MLHLQQQLHRTSPRLPTCIAAAVAAMHAEAAPLVAALKLQQDEPSRCVSN